MRKRRRTRKEKIIADLHRKLQTQSIPISSSQQVKKTYKPTMLPHSTTVLPNNSYQHLFHDLLKTTLLTTGIIALELLLFIAQKKQFFH